MMLRRLFGRAAPVAVVQAEPPPAIDPLAAARPTSLFRHPLFDLAAARPR